MNDSITKRELKRVLDDVFEWYPYSIKSLKREVYRRLELEEG